MLIPEQIIKETLIISVLSAMAHLSYDVTEEKSTSCETGSSSASRCGIQLAAGWS